MQLVALQAVSLCTEACNSLGGIGGLVFAAAAFAWGEWQRRRARAGRVELERVKLSMQPPPPQKVEVMHYSLPAMPPSNTPLPPAPRLPTRDPRHG